ncbi:MAG TPA: RibD family protein, partial [Fimbriimonas sp.]|nr:RibD family protein [Fimbriimonas sp.]
LVGRKTAEQDRAKLTVRREGIVPRQPTRVVIDPSNRLDPSLPIFDQTAPTVHWQKNGELKELLIHLFESGETGVLVEGGATTISHFLREGLVDQLVLYIAPKVLGEGLSWVQDYGLKNLGDAEQWYLAEVQHQKNNQRTHPDSDVKIVYHSRNLHQFLASYSM